MRRRQRHKPRDQYPTTRTASCASSGHAHGTKNRSRDLRQPLPNCAVPIPLPVTEPPKGRAAARPGPPPHPSPRRAAGERRPRPHPSAEEPRDPSGGSSREKEGEKEPAMAHVPFWCPSSVAPGARLPANGRPPLLTEPARGGGCARPRPRLPEPPRARRRPRPPAALWARPWEGTRRGGAAAPRQNTAIREHPLSSRPSVPGICVRGGRAVMERARRLWGDGPAPPAPRRERTRGRHASDATREAFTNGTNRLFWAACTDGGCVT